VAALPASLGGAAHSVAGPAGAAPSAQVTVFTAAMRRSGDLSELPRAVARRAEPPRAHRKTAVDKPTARWVRPGVGILTSPFGMRWGRLHKGIDLGGPYGSPVYAASAGVVTFAGFKNGYHRYVMIDHGQGVVTAYAHMSATFVRVGQHVRAGEQIAREGSEGSGPHLHFEVWRDGRPVNPIPILRKHGVYI
jgi:murein DD-endopeptidase MepM/ murein hydrolase activator NlpD